MSVSLPLSHTLSAQTIFLITFDKNSKRDATQMASPHRNANSSDFGMVASECILVLHAICQNLRTICRETGPKETPCNTPCILSNTEIHWQTPKTWHPTPNAQTQPRQTSRHRCAKHWGTNATNRETKKPNQHDQKRTSNQQDQKLNTLSLQPKSIFFVTGTV